MRLRRSLLLPLCLPLLLLLPCEAERSAVVAAHGRTRTQRAEEPPRAPREVVLLRESGQLAQQTQRLRGGGTTLSRLLPILLGKTQCRILMVGLDAAGKTTILYQLKLGEMTNTAPTLGFNVETVSYKNIEFMVWDMGGQDAIRPLWRHYYENAQALIFVVDSSDVERLDEAREELAKLMGEEQLKDAILLVYANKQDMPEAQGVQEVADALEITAIRDRTWYIQAASATSGDGIRDGLDWLAGKLSQQTKKK